MLSAAPRGDAVEIRVADSGAGIDEALLERIFEPFVQAKQSLARTDGGLGLKSGWFGRLRGDGTAEGFNDQGAAAGYNGNQQARFALASIAYAIAKRDERAISAFANGITVSGRFGNVKDQ